MSPRLPPCTATATATLHSSTTPPRFPLAACPRQAPAIRALRPVHVQTSSQCTPVSEASWQSEHPRPLSLSRTVVSSPRGSSRCRQPAGQPARRSPLTHHAETASRLARCFLPLSQGCRGRAAEQHSCCSATKWGTSRSLAIERRLSAQQAARASQQRQQLERSLHSPSLRNTCGQTPSRALRLSQRCRSPRTPPCQREWPAPLACCCRCSSWRPPAWPWLRSAPAATSPRPTAQTADAAPAHQTAAVRRRRRSALDRRPVSSCRCLPLHPPHTLR